MEVTRDGDLVFVIPPNPSSLIESKSREAKLRASVEAAKPSLFTALRVAFGVGLLASLAAVYSAIFFISTQSSSEGDDRRRDDRRGGGGFFGGPSLYFGPSPFDIFYYRPYYSYGGQRSSPPQMGLLESVYSYVFGDGDPNGDLETRSLRAAAAVIRESGGVVSAEQLAPFVPAPPDFSSSSANVNEEFVLPVVSALQGVASVTAEGDIKYTFEDMSAVASVEAAVGADGGAGGSFLEERPVAFSAASGFNLVVAGGLGVANLVGALYLGLQLSALPPGLTLPGFYGIIQGFYPLLVAYALVFNAAPLIRKGRVEAANRGIEKRNERRQKAAVEIQRPSPELRRKLKAISSGRGLRVVGAGVAYSTAESGQAALKGEKESDALDDFDRRLGRSKEGVKE